MDQALLDMLAIGKPAPEEALQLLRGSRFVDDASGQVELKTPAGTKAYTLKPLGELYGQGVGTGSVEPQDERYMPLLMGIEMSIVREDAATGGLTDAQVGFALDRLNMAPEADPGSDALARRVQAGLRLVLSLQDYSRQEVRQALRKIHKSVQRHTRDGGPRGYLTFARQYVPK